MENKNHRLKINLAAALIVIVALMLVWIGFRLLSNFAQPKNISPDESSNVQQPAKPVDRLIQLRNEYEAKWAQFLKNLDERDQQVSEYSKKIEAILAEQEKDVKSLNQYTASGKKPSREEVLAQTDRDQALRDEYDNLIEERGKIDNLNVRDANELDEIKISINEERMKELPDGATEKNYLIKENEDLKKRMEDRKSWII